MIKSQSALTGEYTYISRLDDALDTEAPDFDARWQQYLDGAADAPLKAGSSPTVFSLRHLKAGEFNQLVRENANGFDLAKAAIVGSSGSPLPDGFVIKVGKNGDGSNIDKAPSPLWPVFTEIGGRVIARMSPSPK